MSITYIRRLRMEVDLNTVQLPTPRLPDGFSWVPWDSSTPTRHANVKFHSFESERDSTVFPCLGSLAGCHRLMHEIATHDAFLPDATWLIAVRSEDGDYALNSDFGTQDCATIQGLVSSRSTGSIQNVGVTPEHRGLGLGRSLVLKALHGFRGKRLKKAFLEVTADNKPAVDLYESIGFRVVRTMYKAIDAKPAGVY